MYPMYPMYPGVPKSSRKLSLVVLALLTLLPSLAHAYGSSVHRMVNRSATTHLPATFQGFSQWVGDLEDFSTAPDERKCCVPGESIKHYIDIDDYPEFFTGTLPHSYAEMVAQYGQFRVEDNGTVPWAILASYQDLVATFEHQDWELAVVSAADLGHYVADSHNPMHLTMNYNGQLTGQYGIHSRHESEMTSRHLAALEPAPGTVTLITDPLEAAFAWIDEVYPGVDQILAADLVATAAAGGSTSSNTYYDRLWLEVGDETTAWIRDASLTLASLWYSAWVEAGSPPLPGDATDAIPALAESKTRMLANVPNPFNPSTQLRFELAHAGSATLQIVDATGRTVRRFEFGFLDQGLHAVRWDGTDQSGRRVASGVYAVAVLDDRGASATGRVVLVK